MVGLLARILIALAGGALLLIAFACALMAELVRDLAARRRLPTPSMGNRVLAVQSYQEQLRKRATAPSAVA